MKTKIVYVLVSDEEDYYYEMVQLSLYSFRLYHPEDTVELAMDSNTFSRLKQKPNSILDDVVPHVINAPQDYTKFQRSRYIKTNLRNTIQGRFLFLDCDTLICGPLDAIDKIDEDVAFSFHNDGSVFKNKSVMKKAGFPIPSGNPRINYNGGVFFVNDTPAAYSFFDKWFTLWKESNINGENPDQPALFQTILTLGYPMKEIEGGGIWNCLILTEHSRPFLKDALVYHYYAHLTSDFRLLIWEHLRTINGIDDFIRSVISNPRGLGYFFFSMTNERCHNTINSGLMFVYENNPKLFRSAVFILRITSKPIRFISRIMDYFFR